MTPKLEADAAPTRINRGVAYGDGRVYLATVDSRLIAYDAATGKQEWAAQLAQSQNELFNSMAPQFVAGRVIVGLSGGEHEARGFLAAYDANTGKQVWRFITIPGPTDPGGNTWPASTRYLAGGGPVWMTPAVDTALGLIYFNVTNPSPDFNGSSRAGSDLYTDSIVAVQATTGKLPGISRRFTTICGTMIRPVPMCFLPSPSAADGAGDHPGRENQLFYVLDRRTGKPLVPTPERPVPTGESWQHVWPTQPGAAKSAVRPAVSGTRPIPGGNLPVYAARHYARVECPRIAGRIGMVAGVL